MRLFPVIFALTFAVTTVVAFTQYKNVEFYTVRKTPPTSHIRTFEMATNRYEYCESTNVTLKEHREILKSKMPAPIDENMSKYQIEFRELLTGILYTENEIQTVLNPRMRAILEGIAASYYEPDVYRAFEVLYEDYIPLRVAGRAVYRELRKIMEESKRYQKSQIDTIIEVTGMSQIDVEDSWSTFMQIANNRKLPLGELEKYVEPQLSKYISSKSSNSVGTEAEEKGAISFMELMICLYDFGEIFGNDSDSTSTRINIDIQSGGNILQRAFGLNYAEDRRKSEQNLSPKRQKYNQKYDKMLIQFSKWKPFIPSGDGRRLQILKGCFVGSENPAVVKALRFIYVDYAALRLSGDWIFKVVSALMNPIIRRKNRRQKESLQP